MTQSQVQVQTKSEFRTPHIVDVENAHIQFPKVNGHNLLRSNMQLPGDFEGSLNIVFVAFQRWQQSDIDSWLKLTAELEASHPEIRTYELPVIYHMNRLSRFFINEGMRAGIPNKKTRAHTITLYTDRKAFRSQLQLPSADTMYILLVDDEGKVVWRCEGPLTDKKATILSQQIETRSYTS